MSRRAAIALALPATDLPALRHRVSRLAENRPAVYRMTDAAGRVIYVGKARRLRTRLLSYFRARYPDDKAARILQAAADINWTYVPSEFAAYLGEMRAIHRHRPTFNHSLNRHRRLTFVRVQGGPAPRLVLGPGRGKHDLQCFGPFTSRERVRQGVRVLNDLLGLRDCAADMPIVFAGQMDLFAPPRRAGCMRYDFGTCCGPCAGLVTELEYRERLHTAQAFFEGRTIEPLARVVDQMQGRAADQDFERAAYWREKFEALEWLLAALTRTRTALDLLSFVYRDPGTFGDDRAYLIRRGLVRASYPYPNTPIEREAFRAVVTAELLEPVPTIPSLSSEKLDEILLVMSWFRQHPGANRRTVPLEAWTSSGSESRLPPVA